jgi:hypothetical protein
MPDFKAWRGLILPVRSNVKRRLKNYGLTKYVGGISVVACWMLIWLRCCWMFTLYFSCCQNAVIRYCASVAVICSEMFVFTCWVVHNAVCFVWFECCLGALWRSFQNNLGLDQDEKWGVLTTTYWLGINVPGNIQRAQRGRPRRVQELHLTTGGREPASFVEAEQD